MLCQKCRKNRVSNGNEICEWCLATQIQARSAEEEWHMERIPPLAKTAVAGK
jgi:hypothetical protein